LEGSRRRKEDLSNDFSKKEYLEKKNRNKLKEKNLPMKKKLQLP